jgi:hypothetical protein
LKTACPTTTNTNQWKNHLHKINDTLLFWCSIGADVVEFELGGDVVGYHGAVDYGLLIGG